MSNREAHFSNLDCCACHNCQTSKRVKRVTDRLQGKPKQPDWNTANFTFGFTGWKQYAEAWSITHSHASMELRTLPTAIPNHLNASPHTR